MLSRLIRQVLHAREAARLARSVEHETPNLRVVGSSPILGELPVLNPVMIGSFRDEGCVCVGRHGLVG